MQKIYYNDINNNVNYNLKNNINNINTSNISIKTNKTKNDLLMEEFYDKENKIQSLHNMANKIIESANIAKEDLH